MVTYTLPNGKTIKVSANKNGVSDKMLGGLHYRYRIIFKTNEKKVSFTFHGSIADFRNGARMTDDDINGAVDCILADAYAYLNTRNHFNFAREYGYGEVEGKRIFNACMNTYYKLLEIMTESELEELNEFVQNNY